MGTRSNIARWVPSNTDPHYEVIYSHWDGYPSYVGRILYTHYQDEGKIKELLNLGDISSLRQNIGVKHDFDWQQSPEFRDENQFVDYEKIRADPRYDMVLAYGRDRGEKGTEKRNVPDRSALLQGAKKGGAEYLYIWENGKWLYADLYNENDKVFGRENLIAIHELTPEAWEKEDE